MARHPAESAPRSEQLRHLHEQLNRESTALEELHSALEDERTALTERNPGQLDRCVERKQTAMETLNQAIADRLQWMREQGLQPGPGGLSPLLDAGDAAETAALWQRINDRLVACQNLNEVNGQVLDVTRESVEHLLGMLQSSSGRDAETVELYTARGKKASTGRGDGGNSLTKA